MPISRFRLHYLKNSIYFTAAFALILPNATYAASQGIRSGNAPVVKQRADKSSLSDPEVVKLSLNSMILFALSDNPDVRMALEREKQAAANTKRAASDFYPVIDLVAQQGQQYNRPAPQAVDGGYQNPSRRGDITLKQVVYDFGQTTNNFRSRKKLGESAQLDTEANVENTLNDTIDSYLQILQYQSTLKDSEVFVKRIRDLVSTVSEMYDAGASSKTTLSYAQSRLASAEAQLNSAKSSLNDAVSNLEFLTGKLPTFIAVSPDELDPEKLDLHHYIDYASENNTSIKLANSDIAAQNYKLDAAHGASKPTVNFLLTGEETVDDGGRVGRVMEGQAILQLNYRIFDGGSQRSQAELIDAQIAEMKIGREKAVRDLSKKIKLAYNQLQSLEEEKRQTLVEISSSKALQDLNRENFKLGSVSIIELIEGEERLNAASGKLHGLDSNIFANTYHLLIIAGYLKKNFFCQECVNHGS